MPNAFQITYISQKQFAIRYLTPNFGTPICYRYEVALFVRAGTVAQSARRARGWYPFRRLGHPWESSGLEPQNLCREVGLSPTIFAFRFQFHEQNGR